MYAPAGITVGLILIAVGAILIWAVTGEVEGLDIDVVGWILIVVGALAALLALVTSGSWPAERRYGRRRVVAEDDRAYDRPRGRRREVIEEDDGPPPPP